MGGNEPTESVNALLDLSIESLRYSRSTTQEDTRHGC